MVLQQCILHLIRNSFRDGVVKALKPVYTAPSEQAAKDRFAEHGRVGCREGRGHFPNEAAALECLCLVTSSLDPTGGSRARWVTRWNPALNAFAITYAGRFERPTNQ